MQAAKGYRAPMDSPILLCTDGSELSIAALAAGLQLLDPGAAKVVVTVMDTPDMSLLTGTGFAGGVVTPEEYDESVALAATDAQNIADEVRVALGLADVPTEVLTGEPGSVICQYAEEVNAKGIVLGSRGRGGIRRAMLGSVSDHVVRNAPCPVVVTGHDGIVDEG